MADAAGGGARAGAGPDDRGAGLRRRGVGSRVLQWQVHGHTRGGRYGPRRCSHSPPATCSTAP
eukprot:2310704-Pleurochrysis_carterae.AAC.1